MKSFGFSKFTLLDSLVNYKAPHLPIQNNDCIKQTKSKSKEPFHSPKNVQLQQEFPKHLSQSVELQNESQEQLQPKRKLTLNRIRNQSLGAPSINVYLEQIEIAKANNRQIKHDMNKVLNNVSHYVSQIKADQKSKKYIIAPTKNNFSTDNKFKPINLDSKDTIDMISSNQSVKIPQHDISRSCLSEQSTARRMQSDNHAINNLIELIKEFHSKLDQLKKLWQNDQRLEKFIKFQVSLKPDLQAIFFPDEDTNHIHLNFQQLQKLFILPKVNQQGEIWNFTAGYQLRDIANSINKILEQQKFQELFDIKKSILESSKTIKELEQHKVIQKYSLRKDYNYLSFQSLLMSNEDKDKNVDKMERQLGTLGKVTLQNRKMSNMINDAIHHLQQKQIN
ncbi:unnamed protein product [Paramecium octaurelia]|uniref:Uncharacterized protein n=1 Tax=Paramecium octaurelia TaxID=43137 RepID=A0A8S1TKY9_PAROT|nr:unnamed protein product [Paramecium octaurelia]